VYLANKKASWFQFAQLTGSGMEGDVGYLQNNAKNPATKIRSCRSIRSGSTYRSAPPPIRHDPTRPIAGSSSWIQVLARCPAPRRRRRISRLRRKAHSFDITTLGKS
jgi:hypothetical protein